MEWTTFHLTVTTPLFTHDDPTTGLRVASIRGAMRYWFRALAGTRIGNNIHALAQVEQKVFGSTDHAAPVRLRLANQPTQRMVTAGGHSAFLAGDDGQWVAYLLGQGHTKYDGQTKGFKTTRPHTRPGHKFTLKIAFSGNELVDSLTLASLWLACAYGGFGARTRKGFGGTRLTHEKGPLPDPWDTRNADTPDLDHYRGLDHLPVTGPIAACADQLDDLAPTPRPEPDQGTRHYPTLGPGATIAVLSELTGGEWWDLAAEVGEKYRRFRATQRHPSSDPGYSPAIKTPEHEGVVHGTGRDFALGALGLPVNYQDGAKVNVEKGGDELRRASPLWFRFIKDTEQRQWRLFSFAFHNTFLPPPEPLQVWVSGTAPRKIVQVNDADVRTRTQEWMDLTRAPDPLHQTGGDQA